MMARALIVVSLCAVAACRSPLEPQLPPSAMRFLAFGDSLTEGIVVSQSAGLTGLTPGLPVSYPFQVDQRLRARYPEQQPVVLNAGLIGENATDALPRLRTVLNEADADVLLLLHGVNDLNRRLGTAPTIEAIRNLIREARGRGLRVFLATLPPQCRGGTPPRGGAAAFLPEFNETLAAMGRQEGAQIVDLFGRMSESLLGPDCLHPLPAGYVRMADVFFEAIIAAFETPRRATISPR